MQDTPKGIDVDWFVQVMFWDSHAAPIVCPTLGRRYEYVAQFNHPLDVQIVCLRYLWIRRNVDKNGVVFILNFSTKIERMISGIHYSIQN